MAAAAASASCSSAAWRKALAWDCRRRLSASKRSSAAEMLPGLKRCPGWGAFSCERRQEEARESH